MVDEALKESTASSSLAPNTEKRQSLSDKAAEKIATRELHLWNANSKKWITNEVITSRYTALNFIPKNLFEQFHKAANCYFAMLCGLQCVPQISITGGVPTIALPLMVVLTATAVKDAIEDYRRHKSDAEENNRMTEYIDESGEVKSKKWTQVKVGDVLIVKNQEFFPADLLLLSSTDPNGIVYIETANLDGETNLKLKQAHDSTCEAINETESKEEACKRCKKLSGSVECQLPNKMLYQFEGTLTFDAGKGKGQEKVPLDPKQILLRACKLRNTHWCLGLVVYTGQETKIQMNSAKRTERKTSKVEKVMFWLTGYIFLLQCLLALMGAIGAAVFETSDEAYQRTYLNLLNEKDETRSVGYIIPIRWLTFILLFSNFIPISLLVTMGIAKLFQVVFIHKDEDMRYKGQLSVPRNSDLNEELGQVDFCFTDKTGTLTCNIMEFRAVCVNGVKYGDGLTEIRKSVLKREGKPVPPEPKLPPGSKVTSNVNFVSPELLALFKKKSGDQYHKVRNLFLHLAINHEVMPEFKEKPDGTKVLSYSASSPDEGALVYGARHFGFEFKERDPSGIVIQVDDGTLLKVRILAILEFNSRRKRSSVICQFLDKTADGQSRERFTIFCKGADSVIKELLNKKEAASKEVAKTFDVMEEFARDGLRTLVLAGRELDKAEFESWFKRYEQASLAMEKRQQKIEKVANEIEYDFEFHGVTGIEDRLQDGVADTIVKMQEAGIKVWMLTGDKVETAINIGVATGLLEPSSGPDAENKNQKKLERPILDWENLETVAPALENRLTNEELLAEAKKVLATLGPGASTQRRDSSGRGSLMKASTGILDSLRKDSTVDMDSAARDQLDARIYQFEEAVKENNEKDIEVTAPKLQREAFNASKRKAFVELLEKYYAQAQGCSFEDPDGPFEAVVCDGSCLAVALESKYSDKFIDTCRKCRTVICCRVSPEQKGSVVRTVQAKEKVITLAIGDGANDCNMISSADVGIGLRGEEGLQAFNVCDYGISQFRFLQYLLLVHGRWAYRRITKLVLYMFYKNIVVVGPQFFYALLNGFSGQKLYHDVMYQTYNVCYTALPILVFGILEQDVSKEMSLAHPELYELGRKRVYFNNKVFIAWMVSGLWHALVVFIIPYYALSNGNITFADGKANDIWFVGTVVYLLVVIVANMKVVVETVYLSSLVYLGLFLSFVAWLFFQLLLDGGGDSVGSWTSRELIGSTKRVLTNGPCWLTIIATVIVACIRDWQWKSVDKIREGELAVLHAVQDEMLLRRQGKWVDEEKPKVEEVVDLTVIDEAGPQIGKKD